MNHPGVFFTLLFLLSAVGVFKGIQAMEDSKAQEGKYICPPCGCRNHDVVYPKPGICLGCGMPLIEQEKQKSPLLEAMFTSPETTFYHHKFFYPVNFLALFIGLFALFHFRKELPMVLFITVFLSLVLYSFKNQLYGTNYSMRASRTWAFFPVSFLLATGPALYLYFSKTLSANARFSKKDGLHFLPVLPVFILNMLCFLGPESWQKLALYNNYDHVPGLAEQLVFICSALYYNLLIHNLLRQKSKVELPTYCWHLYLRAFLWLIPLCLALMILGNFWYFDLMSTWLDYHPVWLLIALFTLCGTYYLVFKKEIIFQKSMVREARLPDAKILHWKTVLEAVMHNQKVYLDPELSLQTLAQITGIKEKDLSDVLNSGFSKSFHDYVNAYRIETVKKLLLDPSKQHLTNVAMAQEAGFNSKSAFFGLFKKHVGLTPGEFKRRFAANPNPAKLDNA